MSLSIFNGRGGSSGDGASLAQGFDIVPIIGQSNVIGFSGNASVDAEIDYSHGRIWQLSPTGGGTASYALQLLVAKDPLRFQRFDNIPDIDRPKWGPSCGTWFARHLVRSSGRDIVLIPAAVGGTKIADWNPAVPSFFTTARDAVLWALTHLPNSRLAAAVWVQGEMDVQQNTPPATYRAAQLAIIDAWRALPTGEASTFIIGQMPPSWGGVRTPGTQGYAIDQEHRRAQLLRPRVVYVPGQDTVVVGDTIHYDAPAQRENGRRMAIKSRMPVILTDGADLQPPTDLAVGIGPQITFKPRASGASLYAIEHRPQGSSGAWTRIEYAPDWIEPGGSADYTFDNLSGHSEVRVASLYHDKISAFTDPMIIQHVAVPTPYTEPDFDNATLVGGVLTVPSTGTNATTWQGVSGNNPTIEDHLGHKVLRTTATSGTLTGPFPTPGGSYTELVVVNHDDFTAQGAYLCAADGWFKRVIWREATGRRAGVAGHNGNGAVVRSGDAVAGTGTLVSAATWYAIMRVYDSASQRMRLFIDGVLVDDKPIAPSPGGVGSRLNTLDGASGGNNGRYAKVAIWNVALSTEQAGYVSALALARVAP